MTQLKVGWEIFRSQAQILFSKKFLWAMVILLGYFILFYVINYNEPIIDRWTPEDILWFLEFPLVFMAIFLNMQLIASEKENRTLEVMFTTAGSRYKVWLLRLAALNLVLLVVALSLSVLSFFTFADIAILGTGLHAFVPAFFMGSLTLYLSVKLRGGLPAGMGAGGFFFLTMMFMDALEDTRYNLLFNPYDLPRQLDPEIWNLWMWQNRITVVCLGLLLLFFALRGLERRERLLR
ncbi:MAG: hypothetical protein ACE5IR_05265 [bacterium]